MMYQKNNKYKSNKLNKFKKNYRSKNLFFKKKRKFIIIMEKYIKKNLEFIMLYYLEEQTY